MIQAYIDEGGTHDQATIIVMAGFVSSFKRWRKFEKQWNAVLNPDGGSRVFHATDCLGQIGRKDFDGWSKERRNALVDALIPIARTQTLASFALRVFASGLLKKSCLNGYNRNGNIPTFLRCSA
jgi:hypothetical protein